MKYYSVIILAVATTISVGTTLQADEKPIVPTEIKLGREVSYSQDIAPILKKNCIACHNAKTKEGELNLESPQLMLTGGDSGAAIEPGKPDDSYLYLVASRTEEPVMPPLPNKMNAHKLTSQEVWKLRRWIELGAKGDASASRTPLKWIKPAKNLSPIYSLTLTPQDDYVVSGIGNRIEVISLTDANNRQSFVDPELKTYAHRDFVNAIAVDPTGKYVASSGYRTVKIWERSEPQVVQTVPASSPIISTARSNNGQFYVVVNQAGKVSTGNDKPVASWDSGLTQISAIAVDDLGKTVTLATGSEIRIIDLQKPTEALTVAVPNPAHSLVFWDKKIISGHADGVVRVWHRPEGAATYVAEGTELKKHKTAVSKLELITAAPAGLVAFSADGLVSLWDLASKGLKNEWSTGADVTSIALSGDRKRLISVHKTGRVVVWNDKKKVEREFKSPVAILHQVNLSVENVAISKSLSAYSQTLVTAADKNVTDRKASLVKAKKALEDANKAFEATKKPKDDTSAALEAVKKEIVAATETPELKKKLDAAQKAFDPKLKAFTDAQEKSTRATKTIGLESASLKKGETEQVEAKKHLELATAHVKKTEADLAALNAEIAKNTLRAVGVRFVDSQRLQIVTDKGLFEDFNLSNGLPLGTNVIAAVKQCAQVLPLTDHKVCLIDSAGAIQVVNMTVSWKLRSRLGPADGKLAVTNSQFVNRVTSLSFSPDGKTLATGGGDPSRDGELLLWDWKAGKLARKIPDAHSDVILSVQFSRDGKQLLTGATDKFVKIFDVASGKMVRSFEGHTEHVLGASWKADSLNIASASADKTIKVWDTQNGSQKRTISGFGKQVTGLNYVGTSDNLVSSCGDKAVRMYQAANGKNYRTLSGAENYLYTIAVTRNEELVISGGQNGIVRVWDGKTGKLLNSIKPVE